MPTSWFQAIPDILSLLQREQPRTILDIGVGFGKYGLLIRDILEISFERYNKQQWMCQIDGVEAFEGYKNPIHEYVYNRVYYNDIRDIIHQLPNYDVILLIDVIEHFEKEEGYKLINELLKHTNKSLIISTPLYPGKQEEYNGNYYEKHKSRWHIMDFINFDYSYKCVPIESNGAQIFNIFRTDDLQYNDKFEFNFDISINTNNNNKLTIGYLLPHKQLTGGMKMLLENMKFMKKLGHKVYAYFKSKCEEKAIPDWYNLDADKEIVIPFEQSFCSFISECDVVIAGWMSQIQEVINSEIPVVYWEQGSGWLFGDYEDLSSDSPIRNQLRKCFSLPASVVSCSSVVSKILSMKYNKNSVVIPNGIDTSFYYPQLRENNDDVNILLVGNPQLRFKGFQLALDALNIVYEEGYKFNVNWVCQSIPNAKGVKYPINFIKMPSQEQLAKIYRSSDIFIFTSWYEGFGMPPLEAMASGVSVISTKCGGVESFIKPGFNGLLIEPGAIGSLAYATIELIKNKRLRELLAKRGRETALKFDAGIIAKKWEQYLIYIVNTHKKQ